MTACFPAVTGAAGNYGQPAPIVPEYAANAPNIPHPRNFISDRAEHEPGMKPGTLPGRMSHTSGTESSEAIMTGGANPRTISRMVILAVVAIAFAGCAAMFSAGDSALLIDLAG
jgi:hypothetical protein